MDKLKALYNFFKGTQFDWLNTQPTRMAAALAFRGIFSLAPLILIVFIMVTLAFDQQVAATEVSEVLERLVGPEITSLMGEMLTSTVETVPNSGVISLLITIGVMLYAATALFYELKLTLNTIWGIPYTQSVGVFHFIKDRLVALVIVFGIGFLFVALVIINTIMSLLVSLLQLDTLFSLASVAASFGLITLVIALLFKFLPDARVFWRAVWVGAPVTSLMLTVGVWLLGIYLALTSVGAAYGGAGALMATLIWLYYSAHIVIVGAAFTRSLEVRVIAPPPAEAEVSRG
ncbi:MAG: hypothetical protein Kow0031_03540 [Anaerolineae bacterium]